MNKQKVIVWNINWSLFEDAKCSQAILDISSGIVIDARKESQEFYKRYRSVTAREYGMNAFFDLLPNSILLLNPYYEDMIGQFPKIKTWYLDEYFTNPKQQGKPEQIKKMNEGRSKIVNGGQKLIYGEPDIDKFPSLINNEEITYSSYQDLWFKIFGLRIYVPFSNQIKTWGKLEEKYNLGQSLKNLLTPKIRVLTDHTGINQEIEKVADNHPSKFNFCWIKLGQRNMKECIQWCRDHNKQICLYIPTLSKEKFLRLLIEFKKYL